MEAADDRIDICNACADLGVAIPQPQLVLREGFERGTREWQRQLYGAAIYWHLASTYGEYGQERNPDMLRGLDVLEVACMRGGGARYLAEVTGARSYLAVDVDPQALEACMVLHQRMPLPTLTYARVDVTTLGETFKPASFDAILGVEPRFDGEDLLKFLHGAHHVLRPGGRLAFCDMFQKGTLQYLLKALDQLGFDLEAVVDISAKVDGLGICRVTIGDAYARVAAVKRTGEAQFAPLVKEAGAEPSAGDGAEHK